MEKIIFFQNEGVIKGNVQRGDGKKDKRKIVFAYKTKIAVLKIIKIY